MNSGQAQFEELERYFADLHDFARRLGETTERFQSAARSGKFPATPAALRHDRSDPLDRLARSADITRRCEFLVAVTGAFSSGKSTLLNALLSSPDLLPSSSIPTTAVCTVLRHGHTPRVEVRFAPPQERLSRVREFLGCPFKKELERSEQLTEALERPELFVDDESERDSLRRFARVLLDDDALRDRTVPFWQRHAFIAGGGAIASASDDTARYFLPTADQHEKYLTAGGDPALWVSHEWLAMVRDVTVWVDAPLLRHNIVFLDLPGLNCREDYHRRAVHEYCNMADCVVLTAFQPGGRADEDVVDNFKRLSNNFRDKLFFVFNRIDQFQTEPQELARAVEYLQRDGVGRDFPAERLFLTSAFLAREKLLSSDRFAAHFDSFRKVFESFDGGVSQLAGRLELACDPGDPGGVAHFRDAIDTFLRESAYPSKVSEVLEHFDQVLGDLERGAGPRYEEVSRLDPAELRRRAAHDYFAHVRDLTTGAVSRFRFQYLRGPTDSGVSLARDLKTCLAQAHHQIRRRIEQCFAPRLLAALPREDPVSEFELRRLGDEASARLRRDFEEIVTSAVVSRVEERFDGVLDDVAASRHLDELFRGAPPWRRQVDAALERFRFSLRHSVLCLVRPRFHAMPGGRDLRRLDRRVSLADLRAWLVRVFSEFYPDWIYQHVFGPIIDDLWLSFFHDAEDLEVALQSCFEESELALASPELLEQIGIPAEFSELSPDLHDVAGICRQIEALKTEQDGLRSRLADAALAPTP